MAPDKVQAFLSGGGQMGAAMRNKDWGANPLGPPDGWPQPLKTLVGLMLAATQPMFIAWGPAQCFLYNDPYIEVLANKHPWALGVPFLEVWSEIRADIEPLADQVYRGEPVHMDDIELTMLRRGVPEETHFAFSYTPVLDERGEVAGLFCACVETTGQVMADRRQAFRLALEEDLRTGGTADEVIGRGVAALRTQLKAGRAGLARVLSDGTAAVLEEADAEARPAVPLDGLGVAGNRTAVAAGPDDVPGGWSAAGLGAVVAVPLARAGGLGALLFVGEAGARGWSAEDVRLIEHAANRIWDTAERAAAETALRESEAHLAGIFAQTGSGFAESDLEGRFLSVNDRFCTLTGRSRAELLTLGKVDVTHMEDRPATRAALARVRDTGQPTTVEKRYVRPNGDAVWVANTISPIHALGSRAAGGGQSLLTVAIDISAQKQIERDLLVARDQAEEANLAKSNFIANMSHELRTPLSAIIGYSEMLQEEVADGAEPAEFAADMGKIESNARHLLGLINDVLDLSKIESGKMEVYAETFGVEETARDVAATVTSLIGKKGNRLELDIGAGLGTAHSDVVKIRQVLLNLLSNAAKFTENGVITLGARRAEDDPDTLVFQVRDNGIGMTPEQLARLFQRFSQADASTTRRFGGTGLGLSITKAFMAMMGGTVTVDSVYGQGTTFTVRLPASLPEPEPVHAAPTLDEAGLPTREVVLVIDDDPAQRDLMTRFLDREGFVARTAPDGATGLVLARQLRPRAILLDVAMPGLDGWSVLRELKGDPALAGIPVVMVTFIDDNGLATTLGAADYVTKPVKWERFRLVMDRFREADGDVLVVDDDADTRRGLRLALERDNWTVTEAANGQEALDRVDACLPRVVLLDLEMPVMDGFAFLHEFRERPGCRDIPVVVITARDLTREDRNHLEGVDRLITKGSTSMSLLSRELHNLARAEAAETAQAGPGP